MFSYERLGNRILQRRKHLKITQNDIASRLSITPQAISKWERGENAPDILLLPELALILGVTTDWLLGNKLESYLRKVNLFADLNDNELHLILPLFERREFDEGEVIYKEKSSMETGFYVIEEGRVSLTQKTDLIAVLKEGQFFSDYSAIDQGPCVTSAKANTKTLIHCANSSKLLQFFKEYPEIGIRLYHLSLVNAFSELRSLQKT